MTASPAPDPGNPADLQPGKTWKADMLAMFDKVQNGENSIWIINLAPTSLALPCFC